MSADITTGDVLAHIKQQLDWRGPSGKPQGHVVLSREHAAFLHERVLELVRVQDGHVAEIEQLRSLLSQR